MQSNCIQVCDKKKKKKKKKKIEVNDLSGSQYSVSKNVRFETPMLILEMW